MKMHRYVSGIIPIEHQPFDFNMPWHDSLMPIAPNWTAIEKAVLECACADVRMIWIICPRKIEPLLFQRIGRSVLDPATAAKKNFPMAQKREIPIYYCGLRACDEDKKTSMAWSIITGAEVIHRISKKFSNCAGLDDFYIAFPYGLYNGLSLLKHRPYFKTGNRNLRFVHKGKSICDGEYLGFTATIKQIKQAKVSFIRQSTGLYKTVSKEPLTFERLSIQERYSGRWLGLKDVFKDIYKDQETYDIDTQWYYNISSWKGYREFLASEKAKWLKRPHVSYFRRREEWGYRHLDEESSE